MTNLTLLDLRRTVAAWERRRLTLLSDLMLCATPGKQMAVIAEIVYLHGAAFEAMVSAALRLSAPLTEAARDVLRDAIAGRAVFYAWRDTVTSASAPEQLAPMAALWARIVKQVTGDEDET